MSINQSGSPVETINCFSRIQFYVAIQQPEDKSSRLQKAIKLLR
jgi:hypothetical protein